VIAQADAVLLAEVYAAGEAPIVAADGRSLARALRVAGALSRCLWMTLPTCRKPLSDNARGWRRGAVHGCWIDWCGTRQSG
jgi:UDP-N-acetylmuramate--alanine ligase